MVGSQLHKETWKNESDCKTLKIKHKSTNYRFHCKNRDSITRADTDVKQKDTDRKKKYLDIFGTCPAERASDENIDSYRSSSRKNDPSVWKLLCCYQFILILLLLCLLTLESFYLNTELTSLRNTEFENDIFNVIVPCDDVSLSLDEDAETFNVSQTGVKLFLDKSGKRICSFNNLTAVIEKATERASRIRLAKGLSQPKYLSCGNVDKVPAPGYLTASFTQLSVNKTRKDKGRNHLLLWDQTSSYSYIGPGIHYKDGKIRVNTTQYYYVYASISFNNGIILDKNSRSGSCLFTLFVLKGHVGYDGEFERIQLKRTEMLHNATSGVVTIHLGSHLLLESDKEFYVKVTNAVRLVDTSASNMFGLFPYG